MLWKKTIEKDLLCLLKVEWLVEVTVPVIRAVPPPRCREKEQFCCWSAGRITGILECQAAIERWYLPNGKTGCLGGSASERWWVGRVFLLACEPSWHVSSQVLLDSWELLVDWRATFTVVFFMDLCWVFAPLLWGFGVESGSGLWIFSSVFLECSLLLSLLGKKKKQQQ